MMLSAVEFGPFHTYYAATFSYRCRKAAAAPMPHRSSANTFWQWKSYVCIRFLEEQDRFM